MIWEMNKTILVTRPRYDDTTAYLNKWAGLVKEFAEERGCRVLDLDGEKANRAEFESYAKKHRPNFFFFNGHGSDEAVTGDQEKDLLLHKVNDNFCTGAIVYIRSCNAGGTLANSLVAKGTKACIGYTTKFGFIRIVAYSTKPLEDPMARIFLEPSNLIATGILKGNTAAEAHRKAIKEMSKSFFMMLSSQGKFDQNALLVMSSNLRGQKLIGDSSAVI